MIKWTQGYLALKKPALFLFTMGAREAKLNAWSPGFVGYSVRLKCKASECVACVLFVLVLGFAFLCQASLPLTGTCSNTEAIRHSLSDEAKQFSLKRHLVKTGGLELMWSKRQRLVFVWWSEAPFSYKISRHWHKKTPVRISVFNSGSLQSSISKNVNAPHPIGSTVSICLKDGGDSGEMIEQIY